MDEDGPSKMYATVYTHLYFTIRYCKQVLPKVIWEERVALAQIHKEVPTGYSRMPQMYPKFTAKLLLPVRRSLPHLIHFPSTNRLHSLPRRASGSNQPFCHSTLSGSDRQTDRTTDGIGDNSIPRALTLCFIDSERRAKTQYNTGVLACRE